MALQGPFPVEFGAVFPSGVYAAGGFEMVRDFDKSNGDRVVQQADKHTGLPLWVVEVIDADPEARQRTVKVKVAAQYQPVLPDAPAGSPFIAGRVRGPDRHPVRGRLPVPGQGTGKCGARLAYSLKATGVRAPSRAIRRPCPSTRTRPDARPPYPGAGAARRPRGRGVLPAAMSTGRRC